MNVFLGFSDFGFAYLSWDKEFERIWIPKKNRFNNGV